MTNEIVLHEPSITQLGEIFFKSGYFQDTRDAAQAVTKIMAGRELGVPPVASMTGIYIVKGKPALGANLIAACVKRSGKYNYRVLQHDPTVCEIEFQELIGGKWEACGVSKFSLEDAKRMGTQNMDKFPRNMLFARAMSNGAKWYCADVFIGGVYVPDELGAVVTYDATGEIQKVEETREVVSSQALQTHQEATGTAIIPDSSNTTDPRTMTLETAQDVLSSDNIRYGDIKTADLVNRLNGIAKVKTLTEEQRFKSDAIKTILDARNAGTAQEPA
jgi:hypothetical protein